MYKVKQRFIDVLDEKHIYEVGDSFESKDLKRVGDLLERGLIVEADGEDVLKEKKKKSE